MSVVVDTGVFVSVADTDEPRHADCASVLNSHRGQLVTLAPVVAETAWLIEDRLGPGRRNPVSRHGHQRRPRR